MKKYLWMLSAAVVICAWRVKSTKKGNNKFLKHYLAQPFEKIKKGKKKKQHENSGEDTKRHKTRWMSKLSLKEIELFAIQM